ncbi:hypothetical protein ACJJTC_018504 [Scirpophaga incertulas]
MFRFVRLFLSLKTAHLVSLELVLSVRGCVPVNGHGAGAASAPDVRWRSQCSCVDYGPARPPAETISGDTRSCPRLPRGRCEEAHAMGASCATRWRRQHAPLRLDDLPRPVQQASSDYFELPGQRRTCSHVLLDQILSLMLQAAALRPRAARRLTPPALAPRTLPAAAPLTPPALAPRTLPAAAPLTPPALAPRTLPAAAPLTPPALAPRTLPAAAPLTPPALAPRTLPAAAPLTPPALAPRTLPAAAPLTPPALAPRPPEITTARINVTSEIRIFTHTVSGITPKSPTTLLTGSYCSQSYINITDAHHLNALKSHIGLMLSLVVRPRPRLDKRH